MELLHNSLESYGILNQIYRIFFLLVLFLRIHINPILLKTNEECQSN